MARVWSEIVFSIFITTFFIFIYLLSRLIGGAQRTPANWPVIGMLRGLVANCHHLHDYFTTIRENPAACSPLKAHDFLT